MAKRNNTKEIETVEGDVSVNAKTGDVIDNATGEVLAEGATANNLPAEIKSTSALVGAGMDRKAIVAAAIAGTLTVGGKQVEVVKTVTRPSLSLKGDVAEAIIRIETPIFHGKKVKVTRTKKVKDENGKELEVENGSFESNPPMVVVLDLLDGDVPNYVEKIMVLPATLHNQIIETYPSEGYVGKTLALEKYQKEGKSYGSFNIVEIAWPMPIRDWKEIDTSGMVASDDKK